MAPLNFLCECDSVLCAEMFEMSTREIRALHGCASLRLVSRRCRRGLHTCWNVLDIRDGYTIYQRNRECPECCRSENPR